MTLHRELKSVFWSVRSRRKKTGRSLVIVDREVRRARISGLEEAGDSTRYL